jgi:CDGSH-type Zn-finger protein
LHVWKGHSETHFKILQDKKGEKEEQRVIKEMNMIKSICICGNSSMNPHTLHN